MSVPAAIPFYAEVGPMVTGADIEHAVTATLKAWLPAYLCEWERQHGIPEGSTPTPRGWAIAGRDADKLVSDQLPCVIIMAGGIPDPPRKEGGHGVYTAVWRVELVVMLNAAWGQTARRSAQGYARATQLVLQQRPMRVTLAGQDDQPLQVDWRGEAYDELEFADSRSYSASACRFDVQCREACWASGGPPPPAATPIDPTAPFDPWVQVAESDTTVQNTPPPEPLPTP